MNNWFAFVSFAVSRPFTKQQRVMKHLYMLTESTNKSLCCSKEAVRCFVFVSSFISTIHRAQVPLHTNKFCSLLFSLSWSCMLQAVINIASLMRRRRCGKLHNELSYLLFAGPARYRSIASYIADKCNLCLPHLHSTPPLGGGGRCWNIAMMFGTEKWFGYLTVKELIICLLGLTESMNVTDGRTDTP